MKFTFIEKLVGAVILFIILVTIWAFSMAKPPGNYRYDPYTDTTTWTDDEGWVMIKSPDGSVRQLSKEN